MKSEHHNIDTSSASSYLLRTLISLLLQSTPPPKMASSISRRMLSTTRTLAGNFGRLWSKGYDSGSGRRIVSVEGKGATTYLQGLVTCDLTKPPPPPREEEHDDDENNDPQQSSNDVPGVEFSDKLRSACFFGQQGSHIDRYIIMESR